MYKEKGITLVSLILYVIVMIIVIGVMGSITKNFYNNINNVTIAKEDILEFNTFNTYFLKEIKSENNKIDSIDKNYILFSSGDSFSLNNNSIYFNNTKICKDVEKFECLKDEHSKDVINIRLKFRNFEKKMKYNWAPACIEWRKKMKYKIAQMY